MVLNSRCTVSGLVRHAAVTGLRCRLLAATQPCCHPVHSPPRGHRWRNRPGGAQARLGGLRRTGHRREGAGRHELEWCWDKLDGPGPLSHAASRLSQGVLPCRITFSCSSTAANLELKAPPAHVHDTVPPPPPPPPPTTRTRKRTRTRAHARTTHARTTHWSTRQRRCS